MKVRVLLLTALLLAGAADTGADAPPPRRVAGYFVNWGIYGRGYLVKEIHTSGAAARMTHLLYAFADVGSDLKVHLTDAWADYDKKFEAADSVDGVADTWDAGTLRGNFNQLKKLKVLHPNLKVLIALGGWTLSGNFSDAALTPTSRTALAASAIDMFIKGNFAPGLTFPGVFDGIDIDWEYPAAPGFTNNYRPEDTQNFTLLLEEFRRQLDLQEAADGREYLLTIAAPAGADKLAKIEIADVAACVDFVNLMTYDFHGTWDLQTHFHAPLFEPAGDPSAGQGLCADDAVDAYLAAGAPAAKLNLGVPFYGRGWQGVPAGPGGAGLFQTGTGAAPGTFEAGVEDYQVLAGLGVEYGRHREATAQAPWLYNPTAQRFWTYDDPTSIAAKMNYVVANGLGGAMFWELSGDDASATLVDAIADGLADPPPPVMWSLTVVNGSGDGDYEAGTVVDIAADPPAAGDVFAGWTGATVADAGESSTTIVMPAANTVVTATYGPAPPAPLAVAALAGRLAPGGGRDRCAVSGTWPVDSLPAPGDTAHLTVAGQDVEWTFLPRGRAKSALGSLTVRPSKSVPGAFTFQAKLKGLSLATGLRDAGLDPDAAHEDAPVDVPVSLQIGAAIHAAADVAVRYTGAAGKGAFRIPR